MILELAGALAVLALVYGIGWIWDGLAATFGPSGTGSAPESRGGRRLIGHRPAAEVRAALARFVDARGGQMTERPLQELPRAAYSHQNARVTLSLLSTQEDPPRHHLQAVYALPPGLAWRAEIFPAVPGRPIDDVRIGIAEFDDCYVLKASDPEALKEFLDEATRRALGELEAIPGGPRSLVSLHSSRLLVRRETIPGTTEDVARFVAVADRFFDRVLVFWQRASGIEILGSAASGEPVHCQVCQASLRPDETVQCRRCRAPHHGDCWEFNGGCATFACGERRFVREPGPLQ